MNNYGAFDPGYGGGKLAVIQDGKLKTGVVPSLVGKGHTDLGELSMLGIGRQRRRDLPDTVKVNGTTYLVGDGVERYAEPMYDLDFLRLRGGPELRALFYDVVYRVLGPGIHDLSLIIGLPVEVMLDTQQAEATLQGLKKWMVGEHSFSVSNDNVHLIVRQVKAGAQPLGALFAWGMDNQGKWRRDTEDLHAQVGMVDIGFNTLDLFAIAGAEISMRYTGGDTLGMRRAAEHLVREMQEVYDMDLSLHKADAMIRNRPPMFLVPPPANDPDAPVQKIDPRPLIDEALGRAATGILSFVRQGDKWGNGRQFHRQLITGGGAEALRSQLSEAFPRAYIMPRPVLANAIGLARLAQQAFN